MENSYFKAIVKKPFHGQCSPIFFGFITVTISRGQLGSMHKLREENKWLQNFSSDFLQLFSVILLESARRILPLKAFWISPVEKRHPLLTLEQKKKCHLVARDSLFPIPGSFQALLVAKLRWSCREDPPRPWLGGCRAGLRGIQQSAC